MAIATFDTLKFANTLKAAGVPDKQAEAEAVAFAEVFQINFRELVTKADLDQVVKELKRDIADLRNELRREIADLRTELRQGLADLRTELRQGLADLRTEFRTALRDEMAKVDLRFSKSQGDMLLMRWMLGVIMTAATGLFVRFIFFKV